MAVWLRTCGAAAGGLTADTYLTDALRSNVGGGLPPMAACQPMML
ncbi:hypothetical protein C4J95_2707 [Pseudomonas orientalis]|nr:hypothetical protein C4J95_2707 [Pseudomonas orientalis]